MSSFKLVFFFCLLLAFSRTHAATFVVSSRLDAGPGTLRDAILKANANGMMARDFIHFNLPGTTEADRTIFINTGLPALTSNIEIDGTTQPGAPFGISNARVRLEKVNNVPNNFDIIMPIRDAIDVDIYGMHFNFLGNVIGSACLAMFNCSDITIGAQNKGNVFNGEEELISNGLPPEYGSSTDIHIAYNHIGVSPDGLTATQNSMYFAGVGNLEMDHNLMCTEVNISEFYNYPIATGKRNYNIHDNIGGGDHTATQTIGYAFINIYTFPQINVKGDHTISIRNNHFLQGALSLGGGYGDVVVQGNKINTDKTGTLQTGTLSANDAVELVRVNKALVGGALPGEKNYLSGGGAGVSAEYDERVTISRNSIFCNNIGISSRETVFVNAYSSGSISGISEPNARIEVFESNKCYPRADCQGKVYIGETVADAGGNWTYTGALPADVVVTATNTNGSTSEFSRARINTDRLEIIPALCGRPGSIKGIVVTGAVTIHWYNEAGNLMGTQAELADVPPGKYTLMVSSNNDPRSACGTKSHTYEVIDIVLSVTSENADLIHPCNDNSGAINNMTVNAAYQTTYEWRNEHNVVVSTDFSLTNVPAGSYRLTVYQGGVGCSATSAPVTLVNKTPPTVDATNITTTPASCGLANGTITGMLVTGQAPFYYQWFTEHGSVVGHSPDLEHVVSGTYRMEVRDRTGCPPAMSAPVKLGEVGIISIDHAAVIVTAAGCNSGGGAIKGLMITNADTYTWRDQSGMVVGNQLDLVNVPAGYYQLTASNSYGCTAYSAGYTIGTAQPVNWSLRVEIKLPVCNETNGEIKITQLTGGTIKSVRWVNVANGAQVSDQHIVLNAGPGNYDLYVTDINNCEQKVFQAVIPRRTSPVFNGMPVVTDESCNLANGAIAAPGITASGSYVTEWLNAGGQTISNSSKVTGLTAGTYSVRVTDQDGCRVQLYGLVVNNNTVALPAPPNKDLTVGKEQAFEFSVAQPGNSAYGLYSDHALQFPIAGNNTGRFSLPPLFADRNFYYTVSNGSCVSMPGVIVVKVIDKTEAWLPTAFSPNGDGVNDIFRPRYVGISSIDYFKVYDRWGTEVFSTSAMGAGWDGNNARVGSYVYIISGKDLLGKPFLKKGSVVLIR